MKSCAKARGRASMVTLGSLPSAAFPLLLEDEVGALEGGMDESDPGV